MPTSNDPLQELRDVHLPDPISFWPPALGWWIVLGIVVIGVLLFLWVRMYRHRTRPRRMAIAELRALKQQYEADQDTQSAVRRLSELIRRYALATFSRTNVAGLIGNAWLCFLDRTGGTNQFTQGIGRFLLSGPYQQTTSVSVPDLMSLVERWIQHVSPTSKRDVT